MAGGLSFEGAKEGTTQILFPFGPMVLYHKLPMSVVRQLNKYTNKTVKDEKKAKKLDHSDHLVGKLKQEILIEQKELDKHIEGFNNMISAYLNTDLGRHFKQIQEGTGWHLHYTSAWIVRQFAGEFNPAHIHTHCDLSCVGYLKLPPEINKEWEDDYKDHYPCKGHIEFIHGSSGKMHQHTMLVKPTVGDFFIFPADLIHMVYPFYSEGERRSFSMNISVNQRDEKQSEADFLASQGLKDAEFDKKSTWNLKGLVNKE